MKITLSTVWDIGEGDKSETSIISEIINLDLSLE